MIISSFSKRNLRPRFVKEFHKFTHLVGSELNLGLHPHKAEKRKKAEEINYGKRFITVSFLGIHRNPSYAKC
jgi:hypothetical protein